MDSGYIMQYIKPDKLCSKQKPGMTSWTQSAKSQCSRFRSVELGTVVHAAGLPKFLKWRSIFICQWLWIWYFCQILRLSTCFALFLKVSSDTQPVTIARKGTECSTYQQWNRTPGSEVWTNQSQARTNPATIEVPGASPNWDSPSLLQPYLSCVISL